MWQLGIVAACIIAIVGLLSARDVRVVKEERARVSEKAEINHAQAGANRKSVTDDNVRRMLEKFYRDKP